MRDIDEDGDANVARRHHKFTPTTRPERVPWDDDVPDVGASSYPDAVHGPEPTPAWVITSGDARDTELGVLKSGKEAEVHLVERRWGARVNLLAAKRYRAYDRGAFRRDATYREARRVRDSREMRAMKQGTTTGLALRAGYWASNELDVLGRLWEAGVCVPYPVQLSGTEVLLEFLGDGNGAAPRLVNCRPTRPQLTDLYEQLVTALTRMTSAGLVHADLSPYNLLVWNGRLYVIDVPQAVELAVNPHGYEFLHRDVVNVLTWFRRQGLACDPDEVFASLL